MDYLYWQVWVSICLQQLLNNILMFLVYCTVKCCPPQLCVIMWVSRNGRSGERKGKRRGKKEKEGMKKEWGREERRGIK